METAVRALNALLMIVLPLALGACLARRYRLPWTLFGWGAVTFVGAQVVHVPLLQLLTMSLRGRLTGPFVIEHALLINAVVLGLAAGVCEETARWVAYRWLVPYARSWPEGLMLGAGHGGAEAIILGLLAGFALFQSAPAGQGLMPLLGTAERIFALADHLALSVLVLQVFVGGRWHWLVIAIGWHALLDGVTFYASRHVSALAVEGILAGFGVVSVAIVVALRRPPSAVTRSSRR
jgi:uncharacterized membrane protein YhfC